MAFDVAGWVSYVEAGGERLREVEGISRERYFIRCGVVLLLMQKRQF